MKDLKNYLANYLNKNESLILIINYGIKLNGEKYNKSNLALWWGLFNKIVKFYVISLTKKKRQNPLIRNVTRNIVMV